MYIVGWRIVLFINLIQQVGFDWLQLLVVSQFAVKLHTSKFAAFSVLFLSLSRAVVFQESPTVTSL